MCITHAALAVFLNLLPFDRIDTLPGRIVIEAEPRDTHWVAHDDQWCTMAPQIDRMARFGAH